MKTKTTTNLTELKNLLKLNYDKVSEMILEIDSNTGYNFGKIRKLNEYGDIEYYSASIKKLINDDDLYDYMNEVAEAITFDSVTFEDIEYSKVIYQSIDLLTQLTIILNYFLENKNIYRNYYYLIE